MRLNEITALKWQDIDYINNVIRVNKTVSWKEGGGIEETLPKSDTSNRDIPMNDTIKRSCRCRKPKCPWFTGKSMRERWIVISLSGVMELRQ